MCLVLAEGERAIVITANYHLNTRGIPIRQHFSVTFDTSKVFQVKQLTWSVLRCVPPYSNISKKKLEKVIKNREKRKKKRKKNLSKLKGTVEQGI